MVVMVMVIIAILRLGMFKMLKMIAYEMTMMAIMNDEEKDQLNTQALLQDQEEIDGDWQS